MKPNFVIIGGQKCGSTYLHAILNEHPDIYLVPGETAYFQDPDYQTMPYDTFSKMFDHVKEFRAVGIKRPDYLAKDECPGRIKHHLPHAKLIIILRDPVSRAIAAYFHYIKTGFAPPLPVNQGMQAILNGEMLKSFPRTAEILEYGYYYKHLKKYLSLFDEKQIHTILLDDIKKDKRGVIKKLYEFLGVNSTFIPKKSLNQRPQKVVYSIPALKLITLKNRFNYTYSSDMLRMHPNDKTLLGKVRMKASNGIVNFIAAKVFVNKKPQTSQDIQKQLYSLYEKDIIQLEGLLQRDLSAWKFGLKQTVNSI